MPRRSARSCCGRTRSSATIDGAPYDGSSAFDSAQFRLERRFSGGYTVLTTYTWSNFKEQVTRLNDTRHRVRGALPGHPPAAPPGGQRHLELPFGHGRRYGSDANALVNAHHRQLERVGNLELAVGPAEPHDGQRLLRRRHHPVEDDLYGDDPSHAGVRHQRLLLPRRRGADQRRGRPGQAARRSADPAGQQRPHDPEPAGTACADRATPTGTCRS